MNPTKNLAIRALIFDFDGLILDTETPVYESWREVYEDFGLILPLAEWASLIGRGAFIQSRTPCHELEERLGCAVDHDALQIRRRARFNDLMVGRKPYSGVDELLSDAARYGVRVGLASSSPREWVVGYLNRFGWTERFAVIRCGVEAGAVKPAPDLYQSALSALGVMPDAAVALEDSPIGIAAAKAAGLFCIAVPNAVTQHTNLGAADVQVASLREVSFDRLQQFIQAQRL